MTMMPLPWQQHQYCQPLLAPTSSESSFILKNVLVDRSLYLFYLTLHCREFHASVSSTVIEMKQMAFSSMTTGKGAKRSKFTVKPLLPLQRCSRGYRYWKHAQGPCHCHLHTAWLKSASLTWAHYLKQPLLYVCSSKDLQRANKPGCPIQCTS